MKPRLLLAAVMLAAAFWAARSARAVIDPSCLGNVCAGTVDVGGQDVDYEWTQNHDETDASFKVRFRSGPYATDADTVRFKITVSKAFSAVSSLKNPSPTASLPPTQTVNIAETIVERSAAASVNGQIFDFVQDLRYLSPAPGTVTVTLEFAQYGAAQTVGPFDVFLDAASPSNRDEGESLAPLFGASHYQCNDGADNDLDYRLDCADLDCAGEDVSPTSVCETPETTCDDGVDNDGNGREDCVDPLCNGRQGNAQGDLCGAENGGTNHANCADGFDNDGNGELDCRDDGPGTGCWRSGFQGCEASETSCTDNVDNDRDQDYSEDIDGFAATGEDCKDYQCKGQGNCPTNERLEWVPGPPGPGAFVDDATQCFNGLDDDLDDDVDCRDPDCLGAVNPLNAAQKCAGFEAYLPPAPLGTGDPFPLFYFNFCDDGIDNDGSDGADDADPDCRNVFGECRPSPATEDYAFLSCANADDDDVDGDVDCGDADCRDGGKLGRGGCLNTDCGAPATFDPLETDAAACAASEDSARYCGDGVDNDDDGAIDCADAGCTAPAERHGPTVGSSGVPPYFCGAEGGAATCHDGADNDSDTGTDCFDSACQDDVECAKRPATGGWTLAASCASVPNVTTPAPIASGGTVSVSHDDRIHVNDPYRIRLTGTATSYSSLTVVIGDAVDPANAFPFDASTGNCALAGTGAGQMTYSSPDPDVGVIIGNAGEVIAGFDVTLTCTTSSAVPLGPPPATYPIALVANRIVGGPTQAEFGETTLAVQVYEADAPTMPDPAVEGEGVIIGQVDVPVGASVRFQGLPDDDASGICACQFDLNGAGAESADGNCVVSAGPFANDEGSFDITVSALDGADNRSATGTNLTFDINVTPSVEENLVLGVDVNGATVTTFRAGEELNLAVKFQTDTLSDFDPPNDECRVFLYDETWVGLEQPAPDVVPVPIGNTLGCQGTFAVPDLAPGRYWIFVEATDSSGDIVRSNVQAILQCENADVGTGACADADFDSDGTPEGRFTPSSTPGVDPDGPTYFGSPQPRACDNCINFFNPNQTDRNANGVGDSCEAGAVGRCKYKYCGSGPDDPAPAGACLTDDDCDPESTDPLCAVVHQLMCTINCSADADCSPPVAALVGVCSLDWGVCAGPDADEGSCCFSNVDCLSGECEALVQPFIETHGGQIYSAGDLHAAEEPPIDNATFCLQSNGAITNFTSAAGCRLAGSPSYSAPDKARNYVGSFGILDVNGVIGGKYGPTTTPAVLPDQLQGKIYYFESGLTIDDPITFLNSAGNARANGLVVVKGDLRIDARMDYQDRNESDLKNLASIGWIVLDDDDDLGNGGGDVFIGGSVDRIVGAFFAEGTIDTGFGNAALDATGMFVAREFAFQRQFASRTEGSEQVTFDARVILNPPPGMADVTRSLPGFRTIPGR